MGCHRNIIKRRSIDFGKTVAGCFFRQKSGKLLFI